MARAQCLCRSKQARGTPPFTLEFTNKRRSAPHMEHSESPKEQWPRVTDVRVPIGAVFVGVEKNRRKIKSRRSHPRKEQRMVSTFSQNGFKNGERRPARLDATQRRGEGEGLQWCSWGHKVPRWESSWQMISSQTLPQHPSTSVQTRLSVARDHQFGRVRVSHTLEFLIAEERAAVPERSVIKSRAPDRASSWAIGASKAT